MLQPVDSLNVRRSPGVSQGASGHLLFKEEIWGTLALLRFSASEAYSLGCSGRSSQTPRTLAVCWPSLSWPQLFTSTSSREWLPFPTDFLMPCSLSLDSISAVL